MGDVAATESVTETASVLGCTDGKRFGLENGIVRQVGLIEAADGFWTAEDA